ncbi:MAG: baeRF11 domain-containing protein [Ancrocorticia sp.]
MYIPTSPGVDGREVANTQAKSNVDSAIRALRHKGVSEPVQEQVRSQWNAVADDGELWGNLSNSLVIFISPDHSEEYVLPNVLESRTTIGGRFDISQLVRAVTTPQLAFALTISGNGWNLWQATENTRASELPLTGEYPENADESANRAIIRGQRAPRRLVGDEGQNVFLEQYAKTVADAVRSELNVRDQSADQPLFLFASDSLAAMIKDQDLPWKIVHVNGSPDNLRPDQIDSAIRERLGALTSAALSERAEAIGNKSSAGLAVSEVSDVARAAVAGAVRVLYYNIDTRATGTLDESTGEITEGEDDLLSQLAVQILKTGGDVHAVREDEITAQAWNGKLLAELRYA